MCMDYISEANGFLLLIGSHSLSLIITSCFNFVGTPRRQTRRSSGMLDSDRGSNGEFGFMYIDGKMQKECRLELLWIWKHNCNRKFFSCNAKFCSLIKKAVSSPLGPFSKK